MYDPRIAGLPGKNGTIRNKVFMESELPPNTPGKALNGLLDREAEFGAGYAQTRIGRTQVRGATAIPAKRAQWRKEHVCGRCHTLLAVNGRCMGTCD